MFPWVWTPYPLIVSKLSKKDADSLRPPEAGAISEDKYSIITVINIILVINNKSPLLQGTEGRQCYFFLENSLEGE